MRRLRSHFRSFSIFSAVGAGFYAAAVAVNGIAIDIVGFDPFVSSATTITFLFCAKYFVYVSIGVVNRGFMRFTLANAALTIATTFATWLLVERAGWPGWFATGSSLAVSTLVRYVVLYKARVIRQVE
ncbi:hypothetical protein ASA1KI_45530 [Opitutales bacterium ASA1]|nr:hypothetical protein ASA1KI_45530 [Opitutales bacterium ASA1]